MYYNKLHYENLSVSDRHVLRPVGVNQLQPRANRKRRRSTSPAGSLRQIKRRKLSEEAVECFEPLIYYDSDTNDTDEGKFKVNKIIQIIALKLLSAF